MHSTNRHPFAASAQWTITVQYAAATADTRLHRFHARSDELDSRLPDIIRRYPPDAIVRVYDPNGWRAAIA